MKEKIQTVPAEPLSRMMATALPLQPPHPSPAQPPRSDVAQEAAALIDVEAVAAMLACSTRHVRRLADAGKMPSPIKLGALLRWRRSDIEAWIVGGCRSVRRTSK